MILPLLTTVHFFLYVHIRFRALRIAIKPNWNNYYNISNLPSTLYLSQMKLIFGSHHFLYLLTKSDLLLYFLLRCAYRREWKLVFCSVLRRVCVRRIYSSIAKDLKFDWLIQVMWKRRVYSLVKQHESWQILQLLPFLISVGAGGLFPRNRLLLCYFESFFTVTCKSSSK